MGQGEREGELEWQHCRVGRVEEHYIVLSGIIKQDTLL